MKNNDYKKSKAYRQWQARILAGSVALLLYVFCCGILFPAISKEYGAVIFIVCLILSMVAFQKFILQYGWRCQHCKEKLPTIKGNIKFLKAEFPMAIDSCCACKQKLE